MITILKVILWDEEIGRLVWDARRGLSYFNYNPRFIRKGLDIAPLAAPLKTYANMPIWGEDGKIYQRLPSFIATPCQIRGVISSLTFGGSSTIFPMLT